MTSHFETVPTASIGSGGIGAAQLQAELVAIYGDIALGGNGLNGLWMPDDAILSGEDATLLVARIGNNAPPITAGTYFQAATLGGRPALANANITTQGGYLGTTAAGAFHAFAVAVPSVLPFPGFKALTVNNFAGYGLLGSNGTSNWFAAGTPYRNGAATNVVTSVPAVYAVDYPNPANATIWLGGQDLYPTRNWYGRIGIEATLNFYPSAAQILAGANACKAYYGIP